MNQYGILITTRCPSYPRPLLADSAQIEPANFGRMSQYSSQFLHTFPFRSSVLGESCVPFCVRVDVVDLDVILLIDDWRPRLISE